MARRIHLAWSQSRFIYNRIDGIRLRVDADLAEGMSEKIFAYITMPMRPGVGEAVGEFDHVCSPVDLEEYPEDDPIPGHQPGWFRLSYVDVLVRSPAEMEALLAKIIADVRALKSTLDVMDTVEPQGDLWIDDDGVVVSSSSSAGSSNSAGSSEGV